MTNFLSYSKSLLTNNETEEMMDSEWEELKQIILHPIETFNSMHTFEKIGCVFPDIFLCGLFIYNYMFGYIL